MAARINSPLSTLGYHLLLCRPQPLGIRTATRPTTPLMPRVILTVKSLGFTTDGRMDLRKKQKQEKQRRDEKNHHGNSAIGNTAMSDTVLHMAARQEDSAGAREAVRRNKELLWTPNAERDLPLHLAVENGHKNVAAYLVEEYPQGSYTLNGASISPLYLAVVGRHLDLVELMFQKLRQYDITSNLKKGESIVFAAVEDGNKEMLQLIYKYQPQLIATSRDRFGETALHKAAKAHRNKLKLVVSFLVSIPEGRTLLNRLDERGRTPLKAAEHVNNQEVINLLRQSMR